MQENIAYMDGTGVVHFSSKSNAVFPMTRWEVENPQM